MMELNRMNLANIKENMIFSKQISDGGALITNCLALDIQDKR